MHTPYPTMDTSIRSPKPDFGSFTPVYMDNKTSMRIGRSPRIQSPVYPTNIAMSNSSRSLSPTSDSRNILGQRTPGYMRSLSPGSVGG